MTERPIIATELLNGQGLGNQLFCYVTTRCIAKRNQCDFSILNREIFAVNIHSKKGMYFMDLDCGLELDKSDFEKTYEEKEERIFLGNSKHDIEHGCYITGADEILLQQSESVILYGNMQDEAYFGNYREQIKEWLKVKPEYDNKQFSKENLCVINIRGGEYTSNPELFLRRKYWLDAMALMKKQRADMEFIVVTDDLEAANRILPEVKAYHFDLAGDYTVIKNAHYLILSNSTFAFFPAFTSDTVKMIIAPKYWARHNVSDGYWASEQNIYSDFMYLDRTGKLFTAQECREELEQYKQESINYQRVNQKLSTDEMEKAYKKAKRNYNIYMLERYWNGVKRRIRRMLIVKKGQ